MGNFAGEVIHTPELLEMLRKHAVVPRVTLLENVLSELQATGPVSDDIDKHTIATMCFGSYFGAFYRGDRREKIPERCRRRTVAGDCYVTGGYGSEPGTPSSTPSAGAAWNPYADPRTPWTARRDVIRMEQTGAL